MCGGGGDLAPARVCLLAERGVGRGGQGAETPADVLRCRADAGRRESTLQPYHQRLVRWPASANGVLSYSMSQVSSHSRCDRSPDDTGRGLDYAHAYLRQVAVRQHQDNCRANNQSGGTVGHRRQAAEIFSAVVGYAQVLDNSRSSALVAA